MKPETLKPCPFCGGEPYSPQGEEAETDLWPCGRCGAEDGTHSLTKCPTYQADGCARRAEFERMESARPPQGEIRIAPARGERWSFGEAKTLLGEVRAALRAKGGA